MAGSFLDCARSSQAEVLRLRSRNIDTVRHHARRRESAGEQFRPLRHTSRNSLLLLCDAGYGVHLLAGYGIARHPCERCGTQIVRKKIMNRSSHLCPVCQLER
ncbi:zinc finger domain-containing protein [Brevibacterium casei]|uniref:zinc finger domain-containing protein n=1 Tax=Brevibacterium casei TaxID=33889 RepID=UPI0027BA178C|nr:zinc finger domain-containing protein [Brevibacterium casei]